jgi:hypothetical protein
MPCVRKATDPQVRKQATAGGILRLRNNAEEPAISRQHSQHHIDGSHVPSQSTNTTFGIVSLTEAGNDDTLCIRPLGLNGCSTNRYETQG